MTDTPFLGLPLIEAAQAQKHVTHNEALTRLDMIVQLAVESRELTAPPSTPAEGDRYIVKATGTGAFAGKDNQIAKYSGASWLFFPPRTGWLAFVADEGALLAWDGSAWVSAVSSSGDITSLQNLSLFGVGATADSTNPFSAKLNNALWTSKTVGEGGDGTLRYKLSKESAAKTLSFLFQDNFSGRAEIGLTGDDDFHFKVSADGSAWIDAIIIDKTSGSTKLNTGFFLTGDISPGQITADQNDYDPAGLSTSSVLRLSSDASRGITGLSGGGDGRIVAIINTGTNNIVLTDASTSSSAANRFGFGADITLSSKQSAVLWYDATDSRWKLLAAPQAGGGGSGTVMSVGLSLPGIFTVSGSPVTNTGTLTGALATQSANAILAGPASGAAASPAFRALTGADLPAPASSTLGGVQAKAAATSNWLRALGTDGVLTASQPDFSDISGTAAIAQGGTGGTTASAARTNLGLGSAATLDVGTSANKIVQLDGSARLPAVDGSQLTNLPGGGGGGSVPADLDILLAELALGLADALNVAQFLGSSGNRFADSFDALTYVDTGGAANLDSGTAGLLKPTLSGTQITIHSWASNQSQGGQFTFVDRSTALVNGVTVGKFGLDCRAAATIVLKIVKYNSAGNYDIVYSQSVSHTGSGFEDFDLTAPYAVPGSGTYYLAAYNPLTNTSSNPCSATGIARAYQSGDATGVGQTFSEDSGQTQPMRYEYGLGADNLTVASTALTAAAAPASAKLVARTKNIDSITLGTDLIFAVSRDGGTTFSNATMNDRFTANSIHVLESNSIDLSAQPSGTSVKWRITTANNKMVEAHDIYVYWT